MVSLKEKFIGSSTVSDPRRIVYLITTGRPSKMENSKIKQARDDLTKAFTDIEVSVVGIGKNMDVTDLESIATSPSNIKVIKDSSHLPDVFSVIDDTVKRSSGRFFFKMSDNESLRYMLFW